MITAFAAIALQLAMSVPVSTSLNISTAYQQATVAAPSVTTVSSGSPSIEQVQVAATQTDETITVRRGPKISYERVSKDKSSK